MVMVRGDNYIKVGREATYERNRPKNRYGVTTDEKKKRTKKLAATAYENSKDISEGSSNTKWHNARYNMGTINPEEQAEKAKKKKKVRKDETIESAKKVAKQLKSIGRQMRK